MKLFVLSALLLLAACNNARRATKPTAMPAFDKQGHRGCRGLMPENTIPAMYKAIDLGVTTLEMDVVVTADSQVVVSHEPWMGHEIALRPNGGLIDEKTEKQYNIYRITYADVERFDVGMKPHPRFPQQQKMPAVKPLLSRLLDSVAAYCKQQGKPLPYFNIEIKTLPAGDEVFHPAPARFVELLMPILLQRKLEQQVIIQSFDFRNLQYLHAHYPAITTAMLIEDFDKRGIEKQIAALGFTPSIYSPHYSLVTAQLVGYCNHHHIRLIPWTVNTKADIERLKAMGVDGIISDYPNLF